MLFLAPLSDKMIDYRGTLILYQHQNHYECCVMLYCPVLFSKKKKQYPKCQTYTKPKA